MQPSFFFNLPPENFLWRRIFFLLSRKFFLLRKTFFFLRRKNLRCFRKKFVKQRKFFLTEVKVLNFFTFWAVLMDVKKVDKAILSTFSKQARRKETAKLMSPQRINQKWDCEADERKRINERPSGLITLKPHKRSDLITS